MLISFLNMSLNTPESLPEVKIVGEWTMCVSEHNGVLQRTNHCPLITFFKDGTGTVEDICNFRWEIKNNIIYFTFQSAKDKEMFISSDSHFNFEIYNEENHQCLKLRNEQSKSWCLLLRTTQ